MEAAATGLPIVACDIRGCRQVVDHGRTGLLGPVRDPGSLRRNIERLLDDPELRRSMSEAALEKAAVEFDQQAVIDRTLATYER
jgi:glycosyltransferase involved in cell wall biosynthesis